MNYKKYIKYILSVTLTVGLSCGLVFAWANLTQVSTGGILTEKVLNDIIDKINENGNKLSNINFSGVLIPAGFSLTNGVVHSAIMGPSNHRTASLECAKKGAKICNAFEYRKAALGWEDNTDYIADDHLFWDGSTSWNAIKGANGSCSMGATVEAGWHISNSYVFGNITPEADKCSRALKYHCCK